MSLPNRNLVCNTRALSNVHTGVQRYADEILKRLHGSISTISPSVGTHGVRGHLWEQFVLPRLLDGRTLWSPCNSGPLNIENQVISVMDIAPLDHPEWVSRKFASWYRFITPRLVRKVRSVITISEYSRSRLLHHFPDIENKIFVTHLAADTKFAPSDEESINRVISKYKIPSRSFVLALGSLEPRKNLANLFEAWRICHRMIPEEICLIIAGGAGIGRVFGSNTLERLKTNIPPRTYFIGYVGDSDLPALYSGAMLLTYLSLYEGFGLPPLEAMACGTPVLVSNTTSLPEVVGDCGLMANPKNIDEISTKLLQITSDSDLLKKLSSKSLIRSDFFSWDKTASKTMQILETVAGKSGM